MLENDVVSTAIYGYHSGRTYEFIGPHIFTRYVSITVCETKKSWSTPNDTFKLRKTIQYQNLLIVMYFFL